MSDKILEIAKKTLRIERNALDALADALGDDFVKAVEHIFACQGRIVVTGIGKSAIVAQKIVATFNSTGTPALFMHAADAIHGDLGMIQPKDIVICLSKSGDTPEIKVLAPLLKNFGNCLIAVVANKDSYLAKQSNYVLHTPIEQEADPNNLAPTTSTTAQIALGDALATAVLALKGFTATDFAQYHPGGALGKQLYLRVRDLALQHTPPSVSDTENLQNTILEITTKRLGAAAVCDSTGALVGIVTDGDLRRLLTKHFDLKSVTAKEFMTQNPKCIEADVLAVEALQMMRTYSISQLIVTENQKYVGMIHIHDLVREGLI